MADRTGEVGAWITMHDPETAEGRLGELFERVSSPGGQVDAILRVHGLRPHTLRGHLSLYKSVLHHSANTLPETMLETIGLWVSLLNGCRYCAEHHHADLRQLADDPGRADALRRELEDGAEARAVPDGLDDRTAAVLRYALRLTECPARMTERDVEDLRARGLDDGAILEVNQATAYFAYANRTAQGLGVRVGDETLGLSPSTSDDPDDWAHR